MNRFSLTHLSNEVLRRELTNKAARENEATAGLLAHIAEFDERKLYLPEAYESMLAYCTGELKLSEDAAKKRIQVARVGHTCPGVFEALESGRVHLTGLRLLAPHITPGTVEELLAAATHKTKEAIERLLAERSPRFDVPARVAPTYAEGAPGHLRNTDSLEVTGTGAPPSRSSGRVTPLSAESFAVQFARSREADERFRYAQDLLGHQVKSGDLAEVYDRAMKALIEKLERVRFGACSKPRKRGRPSQPGSRHIANDVRRAVWKRDGGQCTYTSASGRRCEARRDLQFDHVKEFARGGEPTVGNLRLRCPGHNQHAAEQTFGGGFMARKRKEAAEARAVARAARAKAREQKEAESRLLPHEEEVIPWLRQLGCREDESRIAATRCRDMAQAPLEDRVKRALSWFGARIARTVRPVAAEVRAPGSAPRPAPLPS